MEELILRIDRIRREEFFHWAEHQKLVRQCQGPTHKGLGRWVSALLKGWPFDPIGSSVDDKII